MINLQKDFITDNDLKEYLNFDDKHSILNDYPDFCNNVAGIIGKPIFGNLVFIENKTANFNINDGNLNVMLKI